jgi:hypothetical protein
MGQPIVFDAPLQQATTVSITSPSASPSSSPSSSFTAPVSGQTISPGQPVSLNGRTGTVAGQHPNGKAIVHWDDPTGTTDVPPGITFDPPTSQQPSTPNTISANPEPTGLVDRLNNWAQNVATDIDNGTDTTGIGTILKKMGAHGVYNGNPKAVGDFMASLPLGLLTAVKGAAETAQSGKRIQGAKDIASGALQASQIPGAFIAPEASEVAGAGLGRAGEAVATGAGKVASAVSKPFSLKAVQEALQNSKEAVQQSLQSNLQDIQSQWHGNVRDLFDSVAQEAGVQPKPAESLRDVAANAAAAVKAKASQMYKQLDQAVGGTRFQTYDEQINNVKRALRNSAGIDPDADGRLIERVNQLEDAKAAALDQAKAAGVDPKLIDQANALWTKGSALEDLSKHIQASTSGLRADLAQGVNAVQESLSPAKLATRANRMYSSGRLQQAVGEDHADDLLKAIETTKQKAQDAAANAVRQTEGAVANAAQRADAVKLKRYAAGSVLAGVPGFALLKHLLGE